MTGSRSGIYRTNEKDDGRSDSIYSGRNRGKFTIGRGNTSASKKGGKKK